MNNSPSIGIGITTFNRPEVLEFTLSQFRKFGGGDIVVVDDCSTQDYPKLPCIFYRNPERLGIAKSKNKCISLLKGFDLIFLFDDDCFPIAENWWMPFIEGGMHHYVFANEKRIKVKHHAGKNTFWHDTLGCCLMIDQEVLRTVGGMDNRFGIWGYEHCEYTQRIFKAGLIPAPYITPKDISQYIWAFDVSGTYNGFVWKNQSSIPDGEKAQLDRLNFHVYMQLVGKNKFAPYEQ